jgi:hypothetical protein
MDSNYEVIDNFLSEEDAKALNDLLFFANGDSKIQYNYVADVNISSKRNQFAFARVVMDQWKTTFDGSSIFIESIMTELVKRLKQGIKVYRAKVNLFTRTVENDGLGMHADLNTPDYQTIIYYVNDNNGGTRFADGTFVEQKRNRALIVHGPVLHESVTQTDTNVRVNININYYTKG